MRCPTSAQNSLSRNPLARFVCFQLSLLLPLPLPLLLPHPFLPFKSFFSLSPSLPLSPSLFFPFCQPSPSVSSIILY